MPLDPETVHLITTINDAIKEHTSCIQTHDKNSALALQSILVEQKTTNRLLGNGLTDNMKLLMEQFEGHESDLREYIARKKLAEAGKSPKGRSNDLWWMKLIKYGGGGALLGGLTFQTWAEALAQFFAALAGG